MGKKYSKILTIVLILIIILVIGLLGFLIYHFWEKHKSIKDAENFVDNYGDTIAIGTPSEENNNNNNNTGDNTIINEIGNVQSVPQKYKGFDVIGIIEIPKTGLKYPILSNYTAKSLNTSIVAFYPKNPTLNEPGNVVLAGHNYKNGKFFSNNKKLSNGDQIFITDLNNKRLTYTIYNMFETGPNDTECYNRDTDGKIEITLQTCTDDSNGRLMIEARVE